jgi:DNA modification methylase
MKFEKVWIGDCCLVNADCRDVLRSIPPGKVDAVVTDTPYGIDFEYNTYKDTLENWEQLIRDVMPLMQRIAPFVILPSCAVKRLPWWYANFPPDWIVAWHKGSPGHVAKVGFNAWEPHLCYGRPKRPMLDHFSTNCGFDDNGHPCPKPIEWARWLVERAAPKGGVILDPFMGSGTVGEACVELGRKFIGVELDPVYFEICRKRTLNAVNTKQFSLLDKHKKFAGVDPSFAVESSTGSFETPPDAWQEI